MIIIIICENIFSHQSQCISCAPSSLLLAFPHFAWKPQPAKQTFVRIHKFSSQFSKAKHFQICKTFTKHFSEEFPSMLKQGKQAVKQDRQLIMMTFQMADSESHWPCSRPILLFDKSSFLRKAKIWLQRKFIQIWQIPRVLFVPEKNFSCLRYLSCTLRTN